MAIGIKRMYTAVAPCMLCFFSLFKLDVRVCVDVGFIVDNNRFFLGFAS